MPRQSRRDLQPDDEDVPVVEFKYRSLADMFETYQKTEQRKAKVVDDSRDRAQYEEMLRKVVFTGDRGPPYHPSLIPNELLILLLGPRESTRKKLGLPQLHLLIPDTVIYSPDVMRWVYTDRDGNVTSTERYGPQHVIESLGDEEAIVPPKQYTATARYGKPQLSASPTRALPTGTPSGPANADTADVAIGAKTAAAAALSVPNTPHSSLRRPGQRRASADLQSSTTDSTTNFKRGPYRLDTDNDPDFVPQLLNRFSSMAQPRDSGAAGTGGPRGSIVDGGGSAAQGHRTVEVVALKKVTTVVPIPGTPESFTVRGNNLTFLASHELAHVVSAAHDPKADSVESFVLQRYVKARGPSAFVLRLLLERDRPVLGWMLSNRVRYDDPSADLATRYSTNIATTFSAYMRPVHEKGCRETADSARALWQYLEQLVRHYLEYLVVDFVHGVDKQWYCVQVHAFKFLVASLQRPLHLSSRLQHMVMVSDDEAQLSSVLGPGEDRHTPFQTQQATEAELEQARMTRTFRCRMCETQLHWDEPVCEMTADMILRTVMHIRARLPVYRLPTCFQNSSESLRELMRLEHQLTGAKASSYQQFRVCGICFELYKREIELSRVERKMAALMGVVPPQLAPSNATVEAEVHGDSGHRDENALVGKGESGDGGAKGKGKADTMLDHHVSARSLSPVARASSPASASAAGEPSASDRRAPNKFSAGNSTLNQWKQALQQEEKQRLEMMTDEKKQREAEKRRAADEAAALRSEAERRERLDKEVEKTLEASVIDAKRASMKLDVDDIESLPAYPRCSLIAQPSRRRSSMSSVLPLNSRRSSSMAVSRKPAGARPGSPSAVAATSPTASKDNINNNATNMSGGERGQDMASAAAMAAAEVARANEGNAQRDRPSSAESTAAVSTVVRQSGHFTDRDPLTGHALHRNEFPSHMTLCRLFVAVREIIDMPRRLMTCENLALRYTAIGRHVEVDCSGPGDEAERQRKQQEKARKEEEAAQAQAKAASMAQHVVKNLGMLNDQDTAQQLQSPGASSVGGIAESKDSDGDNALDRSPAAMKLRSASKHARRLSLSDSRAAQTHAAIMVGAYRLHYFVAPNTPPTGPLPDSSSLHRYLGNNSSILLVLCADNVPVDWYPDETMTRFRQQYDTDRHKVMTATKTISLTEKYKREMAQRTKHIRSHRPLIGSNRPQRHRSNRPTSPNDRDRSSPAVSASSPAPVMSPSSPLAGRRRASSSPAESTATVKPIALRPGGASPAPGSAAAIKRRQQKQQNKKQNGAQPQRRASVATPTSLSHNLNHFHIPGAGKAPLKTGDNEPLPSNAIAYSHVPLDQLRNAFVKRVDLTLPLTPVVRTHPIEPIPMIKVSVGLDRSRDGLDPMSMPSPLLLKEGLLVPPAEQDFYSCDPLPHEWVFFSPQTKVDFKESVNHAREEFGTKEERRRKYNPGADTHLLDADVLHSLAALEDAGSVLLQSQSWSNLGYTRAPQHMDPIQMASQRTSRSPVDVQLDAQDAVHAAQRSLSPANGGSVSALDKLRALRQAKTAVTQLVAMPEAVARMDPQDQSRLYWLKDRIMERWQSSVWSLGVSVSMCRHLSLPKGMRYWYFVYSMFGDKAFIFQRDPREMLDHARLGAAAGLSRATSRTLTLMGDDSGKSAVLFNNTCKHLLRGSVRDVDKALRDVGKVTVHLRCTSHPLPNFSRVYQDWQEVLEAGQEQKERLIEPSEEDLPEDSLAESMVSAATGGVIGGAEPRESQDEEMRALIALATETAGNVQGGSIRESCNSNSSCSSGGGGGAGDGASVGGAGATLQTAHPHLKYSAVDTPTRAAGSSSNDSLDGTSGRSRIPERHSVMWRGRRVDKRDMWLHDAQTLYEIEMDFSELAVERTQEGTVEMSLFEGRGRSMSGNSSDAACGDASAGGLGGKQHHDTSKYDTFSACPPYATVNVILYRVGPTEDHYWLPPFSRVHKLAPGTTVSVLRMEDGHLESGGGFIYSKSVASLHMRESEMGRTSRTTSVSLAGVDADAVAKFEANEQPSGRGAREPSIAEGFENEDDDEAEHSDASRFVNLAAAASGNNSTGKMQEGNSDDNWGGDDYEDDDKWEDDGDGDGDGNGHGDGDDDGHDEHPSELRFGGHHTGHGSGSRVGLSSSSSPAHESRLQTKRGSVLRRSLTSHINAGDTDRKEQQHAAYERDPAHMLHRQMSVE